MPTSSLIYLRAPEPEDLELLYTIENDTTLWEVSRERNYYSRYSLKQYLASQPSDIFQLGELRLVICDCQTQQGVGLVDLSGYSPIDRSAEVSICILSEFRGEKYAKSALEKIEEYVCNTLRMHFLYAKISRSNIASLKLFHSLGYEDVAVLPLWHYGKNGYEDIVVLKKMM